MALDPNSVIREIRPSAIDPRVRHETIFAALDSLAPGEAIRLVVDHDPKHLFDVLQPDRAGKFDWRPTLVGPT